MVATDGHLGFKDEPSENRFVFPVGHDVIMPRTTSLRTGELDKKVTNKVAQFHLPARGEALDLDVPLRDHQTFQVSMLMALSG